MSEKSFTFKNDRFEGSLEKLYLNEKGADVFFVFDGETGSPVEVPAHKLILSLKNDVFDAMFFGSLKEQNKISIVDASAAAFKDFLQFFYTNRVQLTFSNLVQVLNLCKKYEMNDCVDACEVAFIDFLTMDDMCWGYSIGLFHERQKIIDFCEMNIKQNATQILGSESLVECDRKLFERILNLVASKWSPYEVFKACIRWSRAECERNNLEASLKNRRKQLGDLFSKIPFDEFSVQQFTHLIASYIGFLDGEQIGTIMQKLLQKNLRAMASDAERESQQFVCQRYATASGGDITTSIGTTFTSNKKLLLTKFHMHPDVGRDGLVYYCNGSKIPIKTFFVWNDQSPVVLVEPLVIEPGKSYKLEINKMVRSKRFIYYAGKVQDGQDVVELECGIEIKFNYSEKDLVSYLVFEMP